MSAEHPEGWPPVPPELRDALDTAKALQADAAKASVDAYRPLAAEQQQAMQQAARLQMAAIFMRDRLSREDLHILSRDYSGWDDLADRERQRQFDEDPTVRIARGALRAADILIAEAKK